MHGKALYWGCITMKLLSKPTELVLPTTEEIKRQELIETLAKLIKKCAEKKLI